ncbi:MAG: bifunctional riboflavin kinase/FAD synthetase [Bacteroidaceae bacterium]|nr:bifunctional riboflavin kinase/FAD synthetase [Bacteroidaceae bacterium]
MREQAQKGEARVASIGFFDGVHRGHLYLIRQLQDEAMKRGLPSMLVTFDRHPRTVVSPNHVPVLLTTLEEKEQLLRQTGVDEIVVLPFTYELSRLSAREFMEQVLRKELNVRVLILGYDHVFGHGGGSLNDYMRWGEETGIEVVRACELADTMVSSSKCRRMLEQGDVNGAREMLGRSYALSGEVVRGFHVGHELGFPTANMQPDAEKLLPANGAYAVWVTLEDGTRHGGMLNIGNRPTIGNGEALSVEVNLMDYEGDLYGQRITVTFEHRLRDEQRFASRDELMDQLAQDEAQARRFLFPS